MVAPVLPIAWAVLELIAAATTAYEIYDLGKTLYDGVDDFMSNKEKAKEYIRKIMEELQKDFNGDIDEKYERQLLARLSNVDARKLQSETTRKVQGRAGDGSELIKTAIKMPMPFRTQLTQVCDLADKVPVIALRRKKGVHIQDLPQAKKKILLELLALTVEELADVDLDTFIVVRMKQLMVSHLLEFADDLLEWRSPMKAEACFGPQPQFADPLREGSTRLHRAGNRLNPFYPLPHHNRGAIAADVAIPDYRKEPLTKGNLFGVVEIKFPGDSIKDRQFEQYRDLSKACATAKTAHIGKAKTLEGKGVTIGARVALFRYPEDRVRQKGEEQSPARKKTGGKRRPL